MTGQFPTSQPDWCNLNIIHRNILPSRSRFFVYSHRSDALSYDHTKSNTICLSGTWKFSHVNSPFDAPEDFAEPTFDTSTWDDIQVPGLWQLQGYGSPQYTNVAYPFPVDPPNVPFDNNQTGSYVRKFSIPREFKDQGLRLRFEGVDSAFHVFVNGRMVGYSQGSRNPSEFDITNLVKDPSGENTLAVRVYQFCDGSYIEDQDQWWLSGIFRVRCPGKSARQRACCGPRPWMAAIRSCLRKTGTRSCGLATRFTGAGWGLCSPSGITVSVGGPGRAGPPDAR